MYSNHRLAVNYDSMLCKYVHLSSNQFCKDNSEFEIENKDVSMYKYVVISFQYFALIDNFRLSP